MFFILGLLDPRHSTESYHCRYSCITIIKHQDYVKTHFVICQQIQSRSYNALCTFNFLSDNFIQVHVLRNFVKNGRIILPLQIISKCRFIEFSASALVNVKTFIIILVIPDKRFCRLNNNYILLQKLKTVCT